MSRPDGREEPVIALTGADFGYTDHAVVRGVDLQIRPGEVVSLLGPNGSGKSTLVKGTLGLVHLLRGRATLFGHPPEQFHEWHRVGYVPQHLPTGSPVPATVREVVVTGRLGRGRSLALPGRRRADDRRAVSRAIATVGLDDRAGAAVSTLSGGQQRRVIIARALATEPELLVLDEPTAGLDTASQEILAGALRRLADSGLTVVVVAHGLGPLAPLITRVVELRDGAIGYDGPVPAAFAEETAGDHPDDEPGVAGLGLSG